MLFLTRKARESLMIGDEIEVFVVSVRGDTVRIGIDAPSSTGIFRKEIYLEIENAALADDAEPPADGSRPVKSTRRADKHRR